MMTGKNSMVCALLTLGLVLFLLGGCAKDKSESDSTKTEQTEGPALCAGPSWILNHWLAAWFSSW